MCDSTNLVLSAGATDSFEFAGWNHVRFMPFTLIPNMFWEFSVVEKVNWLLSFQVELEMGDYCENPPTEAALLLARFMTEFWLSLERSYQEQILLCGFVNLNPYWVQCARRSFPLNSFTLTNLESKAFCFMYSFQMVPLSFKPKLNSFFSSLFSPHYAWFRHENFDPAVTIFYSD